MLVTLVLCLRLAPRSKTPQVVAAQVLDIDSELAELRRLDLTDPPGAIGRVPIQRFTDFDDR